MENIKIIEEKENPLFKKKEIELSIEAEITPTNAGVLAFLSEKFSAPTENIVIKKIAGKFGSKKFIISANIYSSKEEKEATEVKIKPKKATKK